MKKASGSNPYFGSRVFEILVIMFAHFLCDLPLFSFFFFFFFLFFFFSLAVLCILDFFFFPLLL